MKVHKYGIGEGSLTLVTTPEEWKPISAGYQGIDLVLWAEVELGALLDRTTPPVTVTRTVLALPTGTDVSAYGTYNWRFIGTVQAPDGLVFHVYWEPPPNLQ